MKKIFTAISLLFTQAMLYSQAVPNGAFESWNSIPYDEPNSWSTGNYRSLQKIGQASITKVPGFSGSALRITTIITTADTSESYIANTVGDPSTGEGGMPFSQQPTAFTGYYRYNLPGNDTALFWIMFKKNGVIIFDQFFKIRGTGSQSTFAPFSFPISLPSAPDTVIIAATSSNLVTQVGIQNGSFLELDNLAFTGPGVTQQLQNYDFESWTSNSFDNLSGWSSWGEGVFKSTSMYNGQYAVKLTTVSYGGGQINSSGITSGINSPSSGPTGGRPYTLSNDTLKGYYKFMGTANDSSMVAVCLSKNGTQVGWYEVNLPIMNLYTYFEIPISAMQTPDTIRVDAQSSKWPYTYAQAGNTLYLDDLWLSSDPLGVIGIETELLNVKCYPNPAVDLLTLEADLIFNGSEIIYIYDAAGRRRAVEPISIDSDKIRIDVSGLAAGQYVLDLRTKAGRVKHSFVKK